MSNFDDLGFQSNTPNKSNDKFADVGFTETPAKQSDPSWLDKSVMGVTPRGLIKGTTAQLPYIGMGLGGAAGTAADVVSGPVGTIAGAGFGYAAGQKVKDAINSYVDGGNIAQGTTASGIVNQFKTVPKDVVQGMTYDMGGKLVGIGANAAINSKAGQFIGQKMSDVASAIGSSTTGVPREVLETYASNPDEINQLAKEANYNPQTLADNLRDKINTQIQSKRAELSDQLSSAFQARADQKVSAQPIIDALKASQSQINAKLRPAEIDQVNDLLGDVQNVTDKDGQIALQDAHDLKALLQEKAKGAYAKGGQIFTLGTNASRAAKAGGAVARSLVNTAAPEVAAANDTLAQLHDVEEVMNRSMLAEGKTASSLFTAGTGENPANQANLKELGDITGQDFLGEARKIAAARQFGKAPILPVDSTGKSVARMGTATAAGYFLGGPAGAAVGQAASSPLAIKAGINAASAGSQMVKGLYSTAPGAFGSLGSDLASQFSAPATDEIISKIPLSKVAGQQDNQPQVKGYADGGQITADSTPSTNTNTPTSPINPDKAAQVQASMRKAFKFANGGQIPGTPLKPGNSPKNDDVLLWGSPGEIIIPNSITQSPNAPELAKQFVKNIQKGNK
jgi:hypothetical protein